MALLMVTTACQPGDITWLACLFGDQVACHELLNPPPPPPDPVPGTPAAPTGLTAAQVGDDVRLDWNASPETDVVEYLVDRGTFRSDGTVDFSRLTFVEQPPALDVFLHVTGTTYLYRVTARDVEGLESPPSDTVSILFCRVGDECIGVPGPPSAPTGLTVVLQDETGVTLDWNDNPEPDIDHYRVHLSTIPGGSGDAFRTSLPTSHATVSADVAGLVPFVTYFFAVTAVDIDGDGLESPPSDEIAVFYCPSTVAGCPAAPGPLTGLAVTARDAEGVTLGWNATPGANVARYAVYADVIGLPEALIGMPTGTSFLHGFPVAGRSTVYRVAASDVDGRQGPSASVVTRWCGSDNPTCVNVPATPTGLTATPRDGAVFLDWDDNPPGDLAGYVAVRSLRPDGGGPVIESGLLVASQFDDVGLTNGTAYYYFVQAVNTLGQRSAPSAIVAATPVAPDAGAPAAPTGLVATPQPFAIALDWDDNGEPDLAGYNVYLSIGGRDFFLVNPDGPVVESQFTVFDLPAQPVRLYVTAVDQGGLESAPSAIVEATPLGPTAATVTASPATAPVEHHIADGDVRSAGDGRRDRGDHSRRPAVWFELTVDGAFDGTGTLGRDGPLVTARDMGFDGVFTLRVDPRPLHGKDAPHHRPALEGTWRARVDWALNPETRTGATTGLAVAVFDDPAVGRACLRFEERHVVDGTPPALDTAGSFELVAATGPARVLLAGGAYDVELLTDGARRYEGRTDGPGRVPRAGPPDCVALGY